MLLTADHGAQYPADVIGGIPIDPNRMRTSSTTSSTMTTTASSSSRSIRPTQTWVDPAELEDNGFTLDEIAAVHRGADRGPGRQDGLRRSHPNQEDDLVYETAFPSRILEQMPCLAPRGRRLMATPAATRSRLESAWLIGAFAVVLLAAMGWRFVADPSLSAPTRDPAWYTWRANVILDDEPGIVAGEWGPFVDADPDR